MISPAYSEVQRKVDLLSTDPPKPQFQEAARRLVISRATDCDDCLMLLEMLGLPITDEAMKERLASIKKN